MHSYKLRNPEFNRGDKVFVVRGIGKKNSQVVSALVLEEVDTGIGIGFKIQNGDWEAIYRQDCIFKDPVTAEKFKTSIN